MLELITAVLAAFDLSAVGDVAEAMPRLRVFGFSAVGNVAEAFPKIRF